MTAGWQPISTAPRNPEGKFFGPNILVFNSADGVVYEAYYGQSKSDGTEGEFHPADDCDDRGFDQDCLTHWMPRPPDPPPPDSSNPREVRAG